MRTGNSPTRRSNALLAFCAALISLALIGCSNSEAPAQAVGGATPGQATCGVATVPTGFLWGVANSAYQTEGGFTDSNWDHYVAQGGLSVRDQYFDSVDFRRRYPEDMQLAQGLGLNAFRISINWARIQPVEGQFDAGELAYYDDLLATIVARGMQPVIMLDHWSYPKWVLDQGAWDNPKTVEDWLGFAQAVVSRYHDEVRLWMTFNEATGYIQKELFNRPLNPVQVVQMSLHLVETHNRAYDLIHELDDDAMVSSSVYYLPQHVAPVLTDLVFLGFP